VAVARPAHEHRAARGRRVPVPGKKDVAGASGEGTTTDSQLVHAAPGASVATGAESSDAPPRTSTPFFADTRHRAPPPGGSPSISIQR